MNDFDNATTTARDIFGKIPIDITHKSKRTQAENIRKAREIERGVVENNDITSVVSSANITIERAIKWFEERVEKSPEPTVPINYIPVFAQTAIWLRAYMSRNRKTEDDLGTMSEMKDWSE